MNRNTGAYTRLASRIGQKDRRIINLSSISKMQSLKNASLFLANDTVQFLLLPGENVVFQ